MIPKNNIYDNWKLYETLLFALIVTWVPFFIFELYIPTVEKELAYTAACEKAGGFVLDLKNEPKRCIKKDYIIIEINK